MKTVKYYYSKAIHVRLARVVTDDQGEVLYMLEDGYKMFKKLPRVTVASIYDKDANSMSFGVAICSPKDTFKKSEGRRLAFSRALSNPSLTVRAIKRGRVRETSKTYANELIDRAEQRFVNAE